MTAATMVARKHAGGSSRGGGISKRKSAARTDRDGDLVMDSSSKSRGGGVNKARSAPAPGRGKSTRPARGGMSSSTFQSEVLRHVSSGSSSVRAPRHPSSRGLEEIEITGWKSSKAATNDDGGLNSLIAWLEKRSTLKNGPAKRAVKIKKSRVEEETLIISVLAEDMGAVLRVNGFVFAGANIKICRGGAAREGDGAGSAGKESTVAMLRGALERRYNPELKLLDLSALGQDPDLKASAIFDSRSTTSKFFPALMKVLDQQFKTAKEKHEAIQSVTLANNDLPNISAVTTLSQTLPQLRNLDLSNNKFEKLAAIDTWRKRFYHLDHLVLSGNPLEQAEPDYAKEIISWYPKLRLLNTVQVRSDEEAAKGAQVTDLPFPIRTPNFQDEGQIAENFLRSFFAGFDTDRGALANHYYDDRSDFSLAINVSAPRDPSNADSAPSDWANWIKHSRNLKKITQPPAQLRRHFRGAQAVQDCWATLPATRHPDLAAEAKKWLIECQSIPGVPDPTGQSPVGCDGFMITVHGEFDEPEHQAKRSFDRTFIIGPGGPSGVRVVNELLTVRAYGGAQAFEPDQNNALDNQHPQLLPDPAVPTALTPEVAEQMVLELQKQTNMTVGYAKDCLEQVQWDFERSLAAFAAVRANLPPEAFVVPQA